MISGQFRIAHDYPPVAFGRASSGNPGASEEVVMKDAAVAETFSLIDRVTSRQAYIAVGVILFMAPI